MDRVRIALAPCRRNVDYEASLRQAGAEVTVLPSYAPQEAVDALLDSVNGLVLPGGEDIDPAHYGESPHASAQLAGAQRDEFELILARHAVARDLPLLAVCRGLQVLNVALGGSLVQDIPTDVPSPMPHYVTPPLDAIAHPVVIASGSRLARALDPRGGELRMGVNSRHHQALKRLAADLRVSAVAPDGIVEAVEHPDHRFCLGVQWHPENFWRSGEFAALFEGLVAVSRDKR